MDGILKRITLRLIPFLMLLYLIAFLDRVNTSFAALTMNRDLGITNTVFGVGAGIFFLGYFLFEVPSNLMLARTGARRWIAILMVTWGLVSAALAFVHTPAAYMALRFLLGAAEAGFFPGVVLYLTYWLPASARAAIMALFIVAIPLSTVAGAPLSVAILGMEGTLHLHGWQWLFLLEGGIAVLVGATVPLILPNGPQDATWLTPAQKSTLLAALNAEHAAESESEQKAKPTPHLDRPHPDSATPTHPGWLTLLANPNILVLSLAYFTLMIGLYGLGFWIPRILASQGLALAHTGWVTAAPYLISAIGMVLWSRRSDRIQKDPPTGNLNSPPNSQPNSQPKSRSRHAAQAILLSAAGLALAAASPTLTAHALTAHALTAHAPQVATLAISLAGFTLGALGLFSAMPLFWTIATQSLTNDSSRIAGVAIINSIGNLGGFVGPVAMGWLLERTHFYSAGLLAISLCLALGAATLTVSVFGGSNGASAPRLGNSKPSVPSQKSAI